MDTQNMLMSAIYSAEQVATFELQGWTYQPRPKSPLANMAKCLELLTESIQVGSYIPAKTVAGVFSLVFKDIERTNKKTGEIIKGFPLKEAMTKVRGMFTRKNFLKSWAIFQDKNEAFWLQRLAGELTAEESLAESLQLIQEIGLAIDGNMLRRLAPAEVAAQSAAAPQPADLTQLSDDLPDHAFEKTDVLSEQGGYVNGEAHAS